MERTCTIDQMPFVLAEVHQMLQQRPPITTISAEREKPVNVQGAAEHLNQDEQTIYLLLRTGEIPAHKKSLRWYFFKSELNDWIKKQK